MNGPDSLPALGQSLDDAEMSRRHMRFWLLAALGVMLDGFDFFIIGVASPLIAEQWNLDDAVKGLVAAAAIVGAIFGAALLGPLGDKLGRRRIFKYDLILFAVFSVLCIFAWNVWVLIAFRFVLGVAIGLDYPIAASYLAEILPAKVRGRWLVGAFSLQAVGILMGAVVGVIVLALLPHLSSWRLMLGFGVIPALVIIWLRRSTPESPRWLAQNGHEEEAAKVTEAIVGHPVMVSEEDRRRVAPPPEGLKALVQPLLFKRNMIRRTVFTTVPWFLMDIATYGVGIFTPTILAVIVKSGSNTTFLADDIASTKWTAALDIFLPIGFAFAIYFVEKVGRIRLQLTGFAVMAFALCLLGVTEMLPGGGNAHLWLVFVAFALFNTFMNAGPNATTYALPAEVFPSEIRAAGQGFAAGMAKLGAAIGVFFFPILMGSIGTSALLFIIAGCCLIAFTVTKLLGIEPRGRSLGEVSAVPSPYLAARPAPP